MAASREVMTSNFGIEFLNYKKKQKQIVNMVVNSFILFMDFKDKILVSIFFFYFLI